MNRFDRVLWRVNGVILFLILAFAVLNLVLSPWWWRIRHTPRPQNKTGVSSGKPSASSPGKENAHLVLDQAERIGGTTFLRFRAREKYDDPRFYLSSKGSRSSLVNYLYLNTADLASHWLFDGSDRLITQVHDLRAEGNKDRPVVASLYEVVASDTDGDHELTTGDREAVYFATLDGEKPVEIVPSTDGVLACEQPSASQFLIVYRHDGKVTSALFDLRDGARAREADLPVSDQR
ncbi:MAG: hypothetical protein M3R59_00170 [Verrucomicrobiota bacterium]|nr:hypothetical protein [Verrucomicrobiota bacterium]